MRAQEEIWHDIVHANSLGLQNGPAVTFLGDVGDFVVVWIQTDDEQVYYRRFDHLGIPLDPVEIAVVDTLRQGAASPIDRLDVSSLDNGDFIIVWCDTGDLSSNVYGQFVRFDGQLEDGNIRLDDGVPGAGVEAPRWYSVHWDGRDHAGRPVSSGTYIYRLRRGAEGSSKKMILAK